MPARLAAPPGVRTDAPRTLADVEPAGVYGIADYARLFGVSLDTARGRVRAGRVKALPRRGAFGEPIKLLGAELLRHAGLDALSVPAPTETERQRLARAEAARRRATAK